MSHRKQEGTLQRTGPWERAAKYNSRCTQHVPETLLKAPGPGQCHIVLLSEAGNITSFHNVQKTET